MRAWEMLRKEAPSPSPPLRRCQKQGPGPRPPLPLPRGGPWPRANSMLLGAVSAPWPHLSSSGWQPRLGSGDVD